MSKRSMKTFAVAVAATAGLSLALTGCGSSNPSSSPSNSPSSSGPSLGLITPGTLTVCSDVPYAPFEDFDSSAPTGFKGFDVDITTYVAKKLHLKLVWKKESFDGLESGLSLNAGTCDLVASAMTITAARAKHLTFTDGYYDSEQSLLVPDGSSITSINGLSGKKVGVEQGTTGQSYAEAHAKGASVVAFPSDAQEFQALKAGNVDALLQDLPVNAAHAQAGGYKIVQKYDTHEEYGMAVKLGNTALANAVDKALNQMHADGTYKTDYDKYFSAGN